jgi:cellulose synthase/poly-beta-1,6-N-acetylglucosamine synthase-like glycosyltransferase
MLLSAGESGIGGIIPGVSEAPEIAVIVPAHRARQTLDDCLRGLTAQTLSPDRFEVHVVDTGEDGARELVAERARDWGGRLVYHSATETGPGRQRNLGTERTGARFLAFTDADCVPEPQWLEAGLRHLHDGASIVQGPTLTPNGAPPPPFSHAIFRTGPSLLYESCNIMFRADAVRDAGGFSVDLFEQTGVHMGEDTELAWAIRRADGRAVFEPEAVVRHAVEPEDLAGQLRYEWQSRFFPRLLRRVPELRGEALIAGVFLGKRSVRYCGALAAVLLGRRTRWAYLLAVPYLAELARTAASAGEAGEAASAVTRQAAADATREAGLIVGSLRYRSPVL